MNHFIHAAEQRLVYGHFIAALIKKLREAKGISQQVLGDMIGVSQQSINKYENHASEPAVDVLISMAEYFNTSVDYLIGYSEINRKNERYSPTDLNEEELQLVSSYRRLSKKERESIRLILENYLEN